MWFTLQIETVFFYSTSKLWLQAFYVKFAFDWNERYYIKIAQNLLPFYYSKNEPAYYAISNAKKVEHG